MSCIGRFAELMVDNEGAGSVLVRPFETQQNMHFRPSTLASTEVYESEAALVGRVIHARRNNNVESSVQASPRASQPFDPDSHRSPLSLVLLALPLIDGFDEVEGSAVPEVQPRPLHRHMVRP